MPVPIKPLPLLLAAALCACQPAERPQTTGGAVHAAAAPPAQPVFPDPCPDTTVGAYQLHCEGERIDVRGPRGTSTIPLGRGQVDVRVLPYTTLMLQEEVSGTLHYTWTRLVALHHTNRTVALDGALIHVGKRMALFKPTGTALGHWEQAPLVTVYDLDTGTLTEHPQTFTPRPGCNAEDVTYRGPGPDVLVRDNALVFLRADGCGPLTFQVTAEALTGAQEF